MELLSQMWSLLGLLTVLQNILPTQLLSLLHSLWESLQDALTPYSYFDIPEFLGSAAVDPNDLYRHVHLYLYHYLLLHPPSPPPRLTLSSSPSSPSPPSFSLSPNHSLQDSFAGHRLLWTHHSDTLHDSLEERRSFSLRLPKRHSSALLHPYLSHLSSSARTIAISSRDRRIFTNSSPTSWSSVPFRHPATFQTLALHPELRSFLLSDLDSFMAGREFYARVGRPWKRGYLLHGPPGSGKSSLIAAMANHLRYDVYDLELTRVPHNSALKSLLLQITPRSIIVIEDIDCSLQLTGERHSKKRKADDEDDEGERVTLSGLLNFTDGLWSCCGEEKIIVFTTNYKGRVDKALLRPGRMDVHMQLGGCGAHMMREMLGRYVGGEAEEGEEEAMMDAAERCTRNGVVITAAEVGEVLLRNRGQREVAIKELMAELELRINGGCSEELEEGWVEEEEVEVEEEAATGREKRRRGRNGCAVREASGGWERQVRFFGRLRSLTKSESGRRGV
ncbi:AAA-ATPase At4g30250 [Dendrobium catenatum]|uniref:26S protease regulatory subunit 10B like A n=1 Tax=Dendrobium catenatum TaxID=906689 RepID=A0A2I0WDS1_9ASPA|nr:AAA-ATPase At4g30250 [Dendrobium catenatum]PKU73801.1 26S protease regulatory subunit 10B like A [Dendrobium catenatum]